MPRRTKIIATIGPASDSEPVLRSLIEAGMDVARLGLAHESLEQALERYHRIRAVAAEVGEHVGIMVDLPGPKIRAAGFPKEGIQLNDGESLKLCSGDRGSTREMVEVDYATLVQDVQVGTRLAFGDGVVVVEVTDVARDHIAAKVLHGGALTGRPGLHIPAEHLRVATPTAEDLRLLDAFMEVGVDMAAISFVRSAHDIRRVGTEPYPRGPLIVAKIETRAAVENLEGIIEASGAVMVARGDLGAECAIEELPHLQKHIISTCIALGRPAITATQMLESMVHAPIPTRAEASDVANAVFDGSSALMLSGETAIGHDPVHAVRTMAQIARRADEEFTHDSWVDTVRLLARVSHREEGDAITDAMTSAAVRAATELNVAAIVCLTRTGFTVRSVARYRPDVPILGCSTDERTVRQLTMSWGATPVALPAGTDGETMLHAALHRVRDLGHVRTGELVLVLLGSDEGWLRATDMLRVMPVP